jgi:microcystin-dependent protein
MILNCIVTLQTQSEKVTRVSGDNWSEIIPPAYLQLAGPAGTDANLYWIAELDTSDGEWINLAQPYAGPTSFSQAVVVVEDFTPRRSLPLANLGDVNIADLWNRAMFILDTQITAVPLHGATHVGTGLDPVPLADTTGSGLLGQLSGNESDYVSGDNTCLPLAGVPTGTVIPFAGSSIPPNWLVCDGSAVLRSTYAPLYAVLGGGSSPWGQGDGVSTFNLPDLRGRTPIGAGAGTGLSNRMLGQTIGEENHTLITAEIPSHTHSYSYDALAATGGTLGFGTGTYVATPSQAATTGSTGGDQNHNNMQPSAVLTYIIRV